MGLFLKGIILGFIIVLPGMSGGTVFLVLGLYENLVKDILKLKLKPYIPLVLGMLIGIYAGGMSFSLFFENHRDATVAFLLGCLMASVKPVLKEHPTITKPRFILLLLGFITGFAVMVDPIGLSVNVGSVDWRILLIGGAFASAAMIIPGVPGNSILILLGIYDTILFSIRELEFYNLLIFGIGNIIGIFLLLNLLGKLYDRYKAFVSFFFAGLILGSARGMLPSSITLLNILLFSIGFVSVWYWGSVKEDGEGSKEDHPQHEA